jgi:amino acid transporter
MSILDRLLGRYLANSEASEQAIGPLAGIPILGLDALSSSAYGPEAALTILIPLGAMGLHYVFPITLAILVLLLLVYVSYQQTIAAYPSGGGSYTVAHCNLGATAGLLSAAALLIDYVLNVAVGISAGIGALISAIPSLHSYTLILCLVVLAVITLINLRGVRESGFAFMIPTYAFVSLLFGVLIYGLWQTVVSKGHPIPVEPMPAPPAAFETVSLWLILRAFASGCTAMTGVEAVSNGVRAFREPVVMNARRTLTLIIAILMILLLGIAYLSSVYGIHATEPGGEAYESLLSQLIRAIMGRGLVYYVTIGAVITVLSLSANTSFADFPRLCQILANDNYLPHAFAERGRRLVFSQGIIILSLLSALLLIFFGGVTDRLIPMFAIGAFLAFTLSQAGMVVHWVRQPDRLAVLPLAVNLLGAIATGVTLVVVFISKFSEGAWLTALVIPALFLVFLRVRQHYYCVAKEIACKEPLSFADSQPPIAVVPIRGWSRVARKALRFATEMSDEVYGVHVESEGVSSHYVGEQWENNVANPARQAGRSVPKLVILSSPYRKLFGSFLDFIDDLEKKHPGRRIAVVIPNLAERRWYHWFLHNQRGVLLNATLFLRQDEKIVLITVPWYLRD